MRFSICLIALSLSVPLFAQTASTSSTPTPHAMTLDDLFRLQDVGSPEVSPDGNWVAYTVSTIDTTADKRLTDIWMVKWDGSEDIRLTYSNEDSANSPRWSPDGKYLSFTSGRPGKAKGSQVWLLDRRGGEARQLTDTKNHLSYYEWSPDGKKLLLGISEDKEAEAKDKEKDKDKEKEKPKPIVIDRYHFKQDVEGYISSETTPTLLYLFDIDTHKLDKLTTDTKYEERNAVWSPDGTKIAYVSNHDPDPDRTTNTDIFVVDAKTNSAPNKLTTFEGQDGGRLAWSPDSKLIAYLHGRELKYLEYNQNKLAVVPADGGEPRILTEKLDRAVSAPVFAPDGQSVTVAVTDDRSEYLASVSLNDGSVKRLIDTPGTVMSQNQASGHTAVVWTTDKTPGEIFAFEDGKLRKLTTHNDALMAQLKLGETRDLEAKTKDGADVHALLTLPVGYQAGQKYPMLLRIHGGPDGQDAHAFVTERQLFAARGYAVLNVNYRGSAGRSSAYQQIIFSDWGDKEVIDLLACVDEAVKEGVADPDRLGVGGWSYGGILTDYTIASTTRFKAAIAGAGVGNPLAFYGVDQYIIQYDQELGPPWKDLDTYLKLGYPFLHADRIHTPTLFMGGDKDFNVPLNGGEQMYQALRSLNVPTELVVYPGEFHGFRRPSFIRDRYQRYFAWYDKYVMGK
ncbi:S9 family peptidase [Alloacidobacterium sp.]|uniref:S9 family peptidase n=1 Tax=Alloacidobacterium sp. TaxID=2951999 RepID=UPI002D480609|nr:S9 family peptidase [Alloacidobacterium sp.]HYK37608.1 S9 family peptidase [Alloacidobacterium sp.]